MRFPRGISKILYRNHGTCPFSSRHFKRSSDHQQWIWRRGSSWDIHVDLWTFYDRFNRAARRRLSAAPKEFPGHILFVFRVVSSCWISILWRILWDFMRIRCTFTSSNPYAVVDRISSLGIVASHTVCFTVLHIITVFIIHAKLRFMKVLTTRKWYAVWYEIVLELTDILVPMLLRRVRGKTKIIKNQNFQVQELYRAYLLPMGRRINNLTIQISRHPVVTLGILKLI